MIKPALDRHGAELGCGKLPVLFLQLSMNSRDLKMAVMACVCIVASGKGYEIQITEPKTSVLKSRLAVAVVVITWN